MKLSDVVRNYRREADISQREFARRCGVSNSYISFIENERNPKTGEPMVPTIEQYKKIADGMSISVHELFELLDVDSPVKLNSPKERRLNLQAFCDSSEEQTLLSSYRSLSPRGKKLLLERCEELKLLYGKKEESNASESV